jgi:hypothetical protein
VDRIIYISNFHAECPVDPSNEHVVHAEYLTMSENTSYCNFKVVYDVTNPGRLTNMEDWLNEIDCYASEM